MRLTLADIEAELGEFEPFEVDLGDGLVLALPHPEQRPASLLLETVNLGNVGAVLGQIMGEDEFGQLAADERVTVGHMRVICERYYQHFGLGDLGEGDALPGSSNASRKASKRTSHGKAKTS